MGNIIAFLLFHLTCITITKQSRCTLTVGVSSYHSSPCSLAQPVCAWDLDLHSLTADQRLHPPCPNLVSYSNFHKSYSLYLFPHWVKKPNRQGLGYILPSYSDPCSLQCPYLGSQSWTCPYTGPISSPSWRFHWDVNFTQEVNHVTLRLPFSRCGSSMTLLIDAPGYDPLWFISSEPTQPPPTSPPLVRDSDLEHILTPSSSWAARMLTLIQLTLQSTNYSCMVCIDRTSLSSWHVLYTPNISASPGGDSLPILYPSLALPAPRPQPFSWTHCYQPHLQAVTTANCNNSIILPPFSLTPVPSPGTRSRRAIPVAVWLVSALAAGTGIAGGITGSLSLASSRSLLFEVDKDISHLTQAIVKNHQNILRVAQYAAQNRRGLDLLFWEQGGLCKAIQEQCCFLNISNTHVSVLQERPPLEKRVITGWGLNWDLGLSQWAREALQTGITILALLLLVILFGPCILRQLQSLPHRLQNRHNQYSLINQETTL
ncbi:envelope protein [Simian T-lymphotropic virus 2]|uniref:Env polyprotein n=1 Tax=Simian T-lymphotropic virus 2 TaxID=33748 RepID=O09243_9DELA|nr:envelope protein [Simian T-lymphotropic virus 2]